MATFGYGRVSTGVQTTDSQRLEPEQASYQIEPVSGLLTRDSGNVAASHRPAFKAIRSRHSA